jgi:hypothetical protein
MKYTISSQQRFDNPSMPLFEAAERARVRALPLAARRIARRHGLPSATATIIAHAAGFTEGGR